MQYKFDASDVEKVLKLVRCEFRTETHVVEIRPPVVVVGDIHGQVSARPRRARDARCGLTSDIQYYDLLRMIAMFDKTDEKSGKRRPGFSTKKYVFLGDYVDR